MDKQYQILNYDFNSLQIRYTAGKEGFRILEGDHVPRSPHPIAQPAPQQAQYAPQPQYVQPAQSAYNGPQTFLQYRRPQASAAEEDDGQYRESYQRPQQYVPAPISVPKFVNYKSQASQANALQQEPDYHDEPGKPHSFGNGYSFEFAG